MAQNKLDHFTKSQYRILFYRHNDYIMGRVVPDFSPLYQPGFTPQAPAAAAAKLMSYGHVQETPWEFSALACAVYG